MARLQATLMLLAAVAVAAAAAYPAKSKYGGGGGGRGAGRGQPCSTAPGGIVCAKTDSKGKPLICEFYFEQFPTNGREFCVGRADNGAACDGRSFNTCAAGFPTSASCNNGVCKREDKVCSQRRPCAPGLKCQRFTDFNGVDFQGCVDNQREKGETCQQGAPRWGFWEQICKPGLTCVKTSTEVFSVDGVCQDGS
jgi:hypothetical protein